MTKFQEERLQAILTLFKDEDDSLALMRKPESFLDDSYFEQKRNVEGHALGMMRLLVKEFYKA